MDLRINRDRLPKVAYFCMEYGVSSELPIYAGGLGVLAGDYLKAAQDLGVPMIGIGILWRQDYTKQLIGVDGWPYDLYPNYDYSFVKDTGVVINVQVCGEEVACRVRMVDQYGNVPLYLLDTNFPGGHHGWMTEKLYGGGDEARVAQEMLLGIGGIRALRAMGLEIDVYHFNEGHAVFAAFELIREKMRENGMTFTDAWDETRQQVVFTTHTPVLAGNETHAHQLLQRMGAYNGLDEEQVRQIGGDPFSMTVAALCLSRKANAVSRLHGETARRMWRGVPGAAPIGHITNGVHVRTWQDPRISQAFAQAADLWEPHMAAKQELLEFIRIRTGAVLEPETLTIGFARRAAPYKRSELIFRDAKTLEPLLKERRLQLIFSGKAHPDDAVGKEIIADLVKMDRQYNNSVVFLENYDLQIAALLVRGCDVWLNNPRRPMEASGTSGMKAAVNGVLTVSVVDGWVAEGPEHGVSGWLLDKVMDAPVPDEDQDARDLQALYRVLFSEVIPTYYQDRSRWIGMMRASIEMAHHQFCTWRMLTDYYREMYMENQEWDREYMPNWVAAQSTTAEQPKQT